MIGWMLVWSVLNGGVVESNLVFENRDACVDAGHSYGNLPSYTVSKDGELEQLRGGTPFRCLPVNAKDLEVFDPLAEQKELEAVKLLAEALEAEKWKHDILDQITTRITDAWKRPPVFSNGMEVFLRFDLKPNGEVISVRVIRSSGAEAFDQSAIRAVKTAAPFTEISELDELIFEESFESLTIKFSPSP